MPTDAKRRLPLVMPHDRDQLIPWLDHKRDQGKAQLPETQMKLNLAFVLGHQWLIWDARNRTFRRPAVDTNDPNAPVRMTVNKIGGLVERTVAKLTKNAPIPECRPVSDDDTDVSAARVGTRILTHELDRLDWRKWLNEFLFWPTTLGWSYAYVYWDPEKGDRVDTEGYEEELELEEGEELYEGDICLEQVPAFELALDPNGFTMDAKKWAVRSKSMTREGVFEKYGVDVEAQESARSLAQEVLQLASEGTGIGGTSEDWVMVHQLWMVPCRVCPKGRVITWTGEQILEDIEEYPYEHGRLPFIPANLLPGLGSFEGRTWVTDLVPMQTDYNDARSREATIRRTLTPKVLAAVGSMDPQRVTSRVEVLLYNPVGEKPQYLMPDGGWMQQYEQAMGRSDAEMGERAGQGDVSQGSAPAGTPAAAILALQEADDTKLAVSATELASFVQHLGWHILMLARQFWQEERTVRVWSEENVLEARRYLGSDIAHKFDVHVSSESALPRSKSARVQLMLELHARGLIPDPQVLIRALDLPNIDSIVRSFDLDTAKQHRELSRLVTGEATSEDTGPAPWDNHLVHLKVINDFRKSIDYEQLPLETKAAIDAHAAVHEGLVLRQMGVPIPTPEVSSDPALLQEADRVSAGLAGGSPSQAGTPQYLDPLTGKPPDPLSVASGQTPSALADSQVAKQAGIGASQQPGRVPGIPVDNQAASMGN